MSIEKDISEIFRASYENDNFSGVALVKKGSQVVFTEAYGYAHKGNKISNTINTRFDTASITKLFTSVAVLQLIDRGLLAYRDGIVEFLGLNDTAISKDVTIYHLLTHTSGIGDDADEEAGESYEEIWVNKPNYSVRETAHFLPQFIYKPPIFEPGKGCRYNNVAFILLGLAIEKASGVSYRNFVKENVFNRAGMLNTEFCSMDGVYPNVAEGYKRISDESGRTIEWKKNIYSYPPIGSPDGGAYTTAEDLDKFIRSLKNSEFLSEQLTKEIMSPKVTYRKHDSFTEMMGYGFEFAVDNSGKVIYMKKDGSNAGVACVFTYYPEKDTSVVILANQDCNVWSINGNIFELL